MDDPRRTSFSKKVTKKRDSWAIFGKILSQDAEIFGQVLLSVRL